MSKVKLAEFLNTIFKTIGIEQKDSEMILAASALKEIELPEDINTKFDAAYLTPDRAESEILPKISAKLKTENFAHFADHLERKSLAPIIEALPEEYKSRIAGLDKTNRIYNVMDIINEAYSHVKTNGSTEDIKKVNEKNRLIVEALNKTILEKDGALKAKDESFAKQATEIKTDFALRGKFLSHKFAPEFEKDKESIIDLKLNSLKRNGFLVEFDKDNSQVMHLRKNVDGAVTDHYEGNSKVTLDSYLEKELAPFTLKSNGGDGKGTPPATPPAQAPQFPSDRPVTYMDRIKANAS